jgi:hypothetical protein
MENKIKLLLILCCSDMITKIISLILFIKRFSAISKEIKDKSSLSYSYLDTSLKSQKEKGNWTCTSIFKLEINILISILSFGIGIILYLKINKGKDDDFVFNDCNKYIPFIYFLIEGIIWILSSILFYKEIKNYRNQSWNGLRFFWFSNGIFNFVKIATIIYIIIDKENDRFYAYYIICAHCFLSIILLYYSIFRPFDFKYKIIEHVNNEELNSELNPISHDSSLLDFSESFDNNQNYQPKEELLYTITIKNEDLNEKRDIKINLLLKIKTYDFTSFDFTIILKKNDKYKKRKKPSEISDFFKKLIKIYKINNYENGLINLVQQSYNISLTLNPDNNSYTGKKESINTLSHLCNEAIKTSNNFLLDLLLFLGLSSIELVQILENNNIESVIDQLDNFDEEQDFSINNNIITLPKKISSDDINGNNIIIGDKKIIINNGSQMSRDMIKLYTFFNNVLIGDNFISIQILKFEDDKSEIECLIKINNPNREAFINIVGEDLLDIIYDDELKTYYLDNFHSMVEKNDFSILNLLLTDYFNNLIYYDENLFNQFHLNKILKLDIEKFNEDLLINFFENESIECGNDINNFLFEIAISPINGNNIFSLKSTLKGIDKKKIINGNNKEIKIDLNLIKLYLIIDKILPIINSYLKRNFNQLYSSLIELKTYIENYIEIFCNIGEDNIKKMKLKIENEINKEKYKKSLFGEKKLDEFTSVFESRLREKCGNELDEIIEKGNEKIKEINKAINKMLNNKSLKYGLFFSEMRKIFGISKLF